MCGIVSVFGSVSAQGEAAFKELLIIDQLRGNHSTGIAAINRTTPVPKIVKALGTPDALMSMKQFDQAFAGMNRAFIGHNRYATVGQISVHTAHPFNFNHITGVHNGTLRNYATLDGHGDYEVDSQVLYNHIAQHGLTDAVSKFNGAAALTFWNAETREVTLYRNSERPLFIVYAEDKRQAFVASEDWMLYGVLARKKIAHGEAVEIPENNSVTFHIPDNHHGELPKPQLRFHPPKPAPIYTGYVGYSGGQGSYVTTSSQSTTRPVLSVVGGSESKKDSAVNSGANGSSKDNSVDAFLEANPRVRDQNLKLCFQGYIEVRGFQHSLFTSVDSPDDGDKFIATAALVNSLGVMRGEVVTANAQGVKFAESGERFYVLDNRSVEMVEMGDDPVQAMIEQLKDTIEDGTSEPDTLDHKGQPMGLEKWLRKYGTCSHCTGDVDPSSLYHLDGEGNSFCEECATDPSLSDLIKK